MTTLLHMALVNAVTVLPLALLALLISRLARRPALTHSLWVLVLLKFVTPPLFNLPLTIELPTTGVGQIPNEPVPLPASHSARLEHSQATIDFAASAKISPPGSPSVVSIKPLSGESHRVGREASSSGMSTLKTYSTFWMRRPDWKSLLLSGWLAGAAFWMVLQFVRAVRFQRRVLRDAIAPRELQEQTRRLALRLGLRQVPQVLVVNATVSPMLWGCGSHAKLLFPSDLADRLDDNARATLLMHELAHFVRGDHWVRVLELIATAFFWWHPVVWWARHRIEEAEEECCDAWVVSQFPDTPRQYAEALLDTIDFLCESRPPLPPVACGLGHSHFIRHRLTRIMQGAAPKAISLRVRSALWLAAALLLPLQPFVFGSASVSPVRRESLTTPVIVEVDSLPLSHERDEESGSSTDNTPPTSPSFEEATISKEAPGTAQTSRVRPMRGEKVWSTAASPDGRFVVRATTARRVVLTDLSTNSETDLTDERITAVAFAPDGDWFAAAGQDGRVTIWNSASGERLRTVLTHTDVLRSIAVSPRGQLIAVGGRDGSIHLIDSVTGESSVNLPTRSSAVNCVRFSSDGRQLAVAVGDWMSGGRGEVVLLNSTTGRTEATLTCATSPGALTFASNEELIVGLWDGRTQLWNLVNRQVVGSANADKSAVAAAAFSPDNPALREAMFVAEEPMSDEEPSALSVLRRLFANPWP